MRRALGFVSSGRLCGRIAESWCGFYAGGEPLAVRLLDSEFRPLTDRERGLIDKLLEQEFQGRDELRKQLASVIAKQVIDDGTLSLQCLEGPPAPGKRSIANEATCTDSDGGLMAVMLFVGSNGMMYLLEIIKYDGTPIIQPPTAENLVLRLFD